MAPPGTEPSAPSIRTYLIRRISLRMLLCSLCFLGYVGCSEAQPKDSGDPQNGGIVSCDTVPDRWRPTVDEWREPIDSGQTITDPTASKTRYIRARFVVEIAPQSRGPEVCRLLEQHRAQVMGGFKSADGTPSYIVAVPDPGMSWNAWTALREALENDSRFSRVNSLPYGGLKDTGDK
jgi:hypothetical protein